MPKAETPSTSRKRERILDAAIELFSRYGYERTTVDLIAAESRCAKGTVYAYFEDKEGIFRAVATEVGARFMAQAESAVTSGAPLEARLLALLSAKYTYLFELVHGSPHAAELLDAKNAVAADIIDKADSRYKRLLVQFLTQSQQEGRLDLSRVELEPGSAGALLMRSALGASKEAKSAAEHKRYLGELVRVFLAGTTPPLPPPR
jgi:AcrR family transcriptional regulator